MNLTNAILCDGRVFHVDDKRFYSKMITQSGRILFVLGSFADVFPTAAIEIEFFDGWSTGGPDTVKDRILSGLKEGAWDTVRKAHTITVR